jgi:hypothetical protein
MRRSYTQAEAAARSRLMAGMVSDPICGVAWGGPMVQGVPTIRWLSGARSRSRSAQRVALEVHHGRKLRPSVDVVASCGRAVCLNLTHLSAAALASPTAH